MKTFIKNAFAAALLLAGIAASAQTDLSRISLTPYIGQHIPSAAQSVLQNKLNQITSQNGMGSAGLGSRFIITANIVTMSKDVLGTAPPSIAQTLDVTLYIGDGFEGKKFASHTVTVRGVGANENKAYMEAIKQIRANDPGIQNFITTSKNQIITYYNTRCDAILREAKMLEAQNKFEEAIYVLTSVPDVSSCFDKAMAAVAPLFQKKIDRDCKVRLMEAQNIWSANQTLDAANQVAEILTSIDPQAACMRDVKALSDRVGKRVLELDSREWNFNYEKHIGLQKDMIKAYRDVGVAYGNNQPQNMTYNIIGWW